MAPSADDVERVCAAYQEFNARFEQIKAGDLTGFEDYCAADIVMVAVDGWPVSGRYEGLDGYRRWVREVYGGTAENRFDEIEASVVGDYVVATMISRGRADDDPIEMEAPIGVVHALRDGLIARVWVYLGHERALQPRRTPPMWPARSRTSTPATESSPTRRSCVTTTPAGMTPRARSSTSTAGGAWFLRGLRGLR